MSEIIKKDIKEVARTMTREEFLGLDSQQRIDLLNGYDCPTDYGLKSYYEVSFNNCTPTANCTRCWKLAVEDIKFKGETISDKTDTNTYTIHNLLNDFPSETKFLSNDHLFRIQLGELQTYDNDTQEWRKSINSLKQILEMKFTKVEEPKLKSLTFNEAVKTGKNIRYEYTYEVEQENKETVKIEIELKEFHIFSEIVEEMIMKYNSYTATQIIVYGTWFAEGVYEEVNNDFM